MPSATFAPSLDTLIHPSTKRSLDATVELAVSLLKRRQVRGPEPCAITTAHVLAQVVAAKNKWHDVDQLLDRVYQTGRKLVAAQPQELVIGNIIRRVLGLIRDEAEEDREAPESVAGSVADLRATSTTGAAASQTIAAPGVRMGLARQATMATGPYQSMFGLLSAAEPSSSFASSNGASNEVSSAGSLSGQSTPVQPSHPTFTFPTLSAPSTAISTAGLAALRDEILDGIEEIRDEISQVDDQIASFAEAQVRTGDVVLAYEPTRTLEKFLTKAAKRKYTLLLVSKGSAGTKYASLLKKLAAAKCSVIQVNGAAASPYVSRVNRVVLDARAIGADGGVIVSAGSARLARSLASTATVIAVGGVYRVSPETALTSTPELFVEWGEPAASLFRDGSLVTDVRGNEELEIETAATEYVPPGLVHVYVTNLGPHSKDYLESVIADHYQNEELDLYGRQ